MCGIYGSTKMYSEDVVASKLRRMSFRGPDHSGIRKIGDQVILGHNRLSIIDLDARSHQPFTYGHVHIVFNGEIYNFKEIRHVLERAGYKFSTSSDTEVLCAAYMHWKSDCLEKLNGMFSFIIFDEQKQTLFGARDRLGKKPFYYTTKDNYFEFASQPSAIAIQNALSINEKAISQYLQWHYIPDPVSVYNEIVKLEAGHYLEYDLRSRELSKHQYWNLEKNVEKLSADYVHCREKLSTLIEDSVRIRMISDVPIGVFLSGGIDSSLVASFAQKINSRPIKTFSIQFAENDFDESVYAEKISRHLGTEHTTIPCTYDEGIDLIENISTYFDEPFGDGSAIPTMLLAKHTRKYVTVALSGDGGDEAFLGYKRYDWIKAFERISRFPAGLRKLSAGALGQFDNKRLKSIANVLPLTSVEEMYKAIVSSSGTDYLIDSSLGRIEQYGEWLTDGNADLVERVADYDMKTYLNNDINTKVDRATMAFSLESRGPLMDYRVVEFARTLPTRYKYRKGTGKIILRDILSQHVPNDLFERPKQGFGMPLSHWFRNQLKPLVYDTLTQNHLKVIPNLDCSKVQRSIESHMRGEIDHNVLIWDLIVLVKWFQGQKQLKN